MRLIVIMLLAGFGVSCSSSAKKTEKLQDVVQGTIQQQSNPGGVNDYDSAAQKVRATLEKFVAVDTTNPPGNESRIVALVAPRLKEAGIPFEVTEFATGRQNIVARLKAQTPSGLKPLLILAHTDVVGAQNQNWATDPHKVTEKDGYLYGRGVFDDLGMAAVSLETFLMLKKNNVPLKRDVILALTGDEESSGTGIKWLLKNKPESISAGIALNEGGGLGTDKPGTVQIIAYQAAEKTYVDYKLTAEGPTGHSSVPMKGNAIYKMARALERLSKYEQPPRILPFTRGYLAARASTESPEIARALKQVTAVKGKLPAGAMKVIATNPSLYANFHTTCVATMINGGTRANALPSQAAANVNCRILPDETPEAVQKKLAEIIADKDIKIVADDFGGTNEPSPVTGEGPAAIEKIAHSMWPGIPVVPFLSRGATDSRWLRQKGVAAYGIHPIAMSEADTRRAHGIDERIPVASLRPGFEFFYRLVNELAVPTAP